jgi:hypothetical protein
MWFLNGWDVRWKKFTGMVKNDKESILFDIWMIKNEKLFKSEFNCV